MAEDQLARCQRYNRQRSECGSLGVPRLGETFEIQDQDRLAKKRGTLVVKRPALLSDGQYGLEFEFAVVELADWLCVLGAPTAKPLEIRMQIFSHPSFEGDFVPLAIFGFLSQAARIPCDANHRPPLPSSVNRLWRAGRDRVYRSKRYDTWRKPAGWGAGIPAPGPHRRAQFQRFDLCSHLFSPGIIFSTPNECRLSTAPVHCACYRQRQHTDPHRT